MRIRYLTVASLAVALTGCRDMTAPDATARPVAPDASVDGGSGALLGALGGAESRGFGINDAGTVVGSAADAAGNILAFRYTPAGRMAALGSLGGATSSAQAVNKSEQITGYARTASGAAHVFLWTISAGMTDLGTLTPGGEAFGRDIANNGDVVGHATTATGALHAFYYRPGAGFRDIGTLGGAASYGVALNEAGQVVGFSGTSTGRYHAFIWSAAAGMQDLGTIPGGTQCFASGINESAQVAGYCIVGDTLSHAFLWSAATGMQDLGFLAASHSVAQGLNDKGQVVGYATDINGLWRATFWTAAAGMQDLGLAPTGTTTFAYKVNASGQVAGMGVPASGRYTAMTWTVGTLGTPPTANAGGPYAGTDGAAVAFTAATSSAAVGSGPLRYDWDFGDGSSGAGVAPAHVYATPGTYSTILLVTDAKGLQTRSAVTVRIATGAPVVSLQTDAMIYTGTTLNYKGTFSDASGSADGPWAYTLSWGAGTPTTGSALAQGVIALPHVYPTAGTYTAKLTITDKGGRAGTDQRTITVMAQPTTFTTVSIDIVPASGTNQIQLRNAGLVPVAVLGSATFDATKVNPSTVWFGEASFGFLPPVTDVARCGGACTTTVDVNGDGRLDLLLNFDSVPMQVVSTSTTATFTLWMKSTSGTQFHGTGSATLVP